MFRWETNGIYRAHRHALSGASQGENIEDGPLGVTTTLVWSPGSSVFLLDCLILRGKILTLFQFWSLRKQPHIFLCKMWLVDKMVSGFSSWQGNRLFLLLVFTLSYLSCLESPCYTRAASGTPPHSMSRYTVPMRTVA